MDQHSAEPGALRGLLAALTASVLGVTLVATLAGQHADDRTGSTRQAGDAEVVDLAGLLPAAATRPLAAAEDCAELLDRYVEAALPQVTAWGWRHPHWHDGPLFTLARSNLATLADAGPRDADTSRPAVASVTGTNVQEADVDEPDIAKTDGRHVYRVRGSRVVTVHDTAGREPTRIARIRLPRRVGAAELLLADERLVVLGQEWGRRGGRGARAWVDAIAMPAAGHTRLTAYDVSDPAAPRLVSDDVVDGSVLSARVHGAGSDATVRVALSHELPDLDFVHPGRRPGADRRLTRREARAHNRAVVRRSTIEDWVPRTRPARAGNGARGERWVGCTDVRHAAEGAGARTVSIAGWSATEGPTARVGTAVTTDSRLLYAAADRMYLATVDHGWPSTAPRRGTERAEPEEPSTQVHAFGLDGAVTSYIGSGTVPGTVQDRWSLDAHDGTLRVASALGPRSWSPRENAVTVLREHGSALVRVGHVAGMGEREQIRSVRWFDDLAVLVTFRQVDPLYTVDLTEPADPTLLGELKIPGFSAYLHPIGGDRLLGLGQDASRRGRLRGAQASVFDLTDLRTPRQESRERLGRRTFWATEHDPRAFTWLPEHGVALAPIGSWSSRGGTRVAVVRPGERSVSVRLGADLGRVDAGRVRTLALEDGRVAVVGPRAVAVLDLDATTPLQP